ncbi:hypothetical protein SprV_0401689900 [Sparganum proliferum]
MLKLLSQRDACNSSAERCTLTLELALGYCEQGDFSAAIEEYKVLLVSLEAGTDRLKTALCYRSLSECFLELSDFNEAIRYASMYLKAARGIRNLLEEQRAFVTVGRCFLCRSDNLKNGELARKSLMAAQQALLNSIKCISSLKELSATEAAEMKGVSLLNLGQVLRSLGEVESASERFEQCINLARNTPNCLCSPGLIFEDRYSGPLNCLQSHKRDLLMMLSPFAAAMKINGLLEKIQQFTSSTAEDLLQVSRLYESLGDIYSSLELHGPALRHYQQMVNWAEASFENQRKSVTSPEQLPILSETVKHMDAALVSAAEASRSLGAYVMCAEFYRREIDLIIKSPSFSISASLSASELWQSWLSLARALVLTPKNTPASFVSTFTSTSLPSSRATEEALCAALAAARGTDSVEAVRECLEELVEYHKSCGNTTTTQKFSAELRALPEPDDLQSQRSSQGRQRRGRTPSSQRVPEVEENNEDDGSGSSPTPSGEGIDLLSSDSDIEKLIDLSGAPSDILESPGNRRRGKALCLKTNLKGESPLHVAAINGNLEHVVKLVEVLAHPLNVRDGAGWLPIHEAAFHDRTDIANYLLDRGALIDDLGCPEDSSPPLFEALHNGSLRTAILLVNRGANLWHMNKAGETLSDLINNWKPKKRGSVSMEQQSSLLINLLDAIKQKLGDAYEKWCSYRPSRRASVPRRRSANSSLAKPPTATSSSSMAGPARRSIVSSESSDEEEEEEDRLSVIVRRGKKKAPKTKMAQPGRPSTSRVDLDSPPELTEAVQDYRIAMQVVGSSASRFPSQPVDKKQRRKRPSAIPADNDDSWLEDDMGTRRTSGQPQRPKLPRNVSPETGEESPSRAVRVSQRPPRETWTAISSPSHQQEQEHFEAAVLFDPRELLSSTHMELPALTQLNTSPVKSSLKPAEVPPPASTSAPALDTKWCTIKVTFPDISLLLPVDTQSRTVAWVAEEALRRRGLLLHGGTDSTTTSPAATPLGRATARLRTCDGALLLPSDLLFSVLPTSALSTGATTELLAEVLEPVTASAPTKLPTVTPSSQHGGALRAYSRPHGVDASLPLGNPALPRALSVSNELANFSPRVCKTLQEALLTGVLNLSHLSLGAASLTTALATYARISQQPVVELLLDGNLLSPKDIQPPCLAEEASFATVFRDLVCRSPGLRTLSLAENFLTADSLLSLLSFAANTENSSQPVVGAPLGQLSRLNLSYNPLFTHTPSSPLTAAPNSTISPNWLNEFTESESPNQPPSLLSLLLRLCPNLSFFGLAGCSLTPELFLEGNVLEASPYFTVSRRQNLDAAAPTFSHLVELDLSWNPLTAEFSSVEFLFSLLGMASKQQTHFASLRCLRLRGCLQAPSKQGGSSGLLIPNDVTGSWLSSDGDCGYSVQKDSAVSGDCLISCLAKLLDAGSFHIQTLDVGHCNLTAGCLLSLQRLLAAPSTSLTSLVCDGNPALRSVSAQEGSMWSRILATSAQASSALVNLCIDFPLLSTEEDLTEAIQAVSLKLSASSSPTPLQEFCLKATLPDVFAGRPGKTPIVTCLGASSYPAVSPSCSQFPVLAGTTLAARFLRSVAQAFLARFGKLASVTSENCSVTFTIR